MKRQIIWAPLINDLFPANRDVTILEMTPSLMTGEGGAGKEPAYTAFNAQRRKD